MADYHKKLAACLRHETPGSGSPYEVPGRTLQPGPRIDANFPDATWRSRIKGWAEGTNLSRFLPSAQESAVRAATAALTGTLTRSRPEARSANLGTELGRQLSLPPPAPHASPDQARLQRSIIVLESLIATQKHGSPKDTLLAVSTLSPAAQRQLFMADEMTGNRFYQAMHRAQKEYAALQVGKPPEARDLPDLERIFSDVRAQSQVASAMVRMNKRDPSGSEARLTAQFVDHLQTSGVSREAQKAFANKLEHRSRIAGGHDDDADLAPLSKWKPIDNVDQDAEGRFTGQLYAALAETPGVGDEDLAKSMMLSETALVRLTAHSALRNREGDRRIFQLVSESVREDVVKEKNPALSHLHHVLENVSGGRYDPGKFAQLASKGETSASISGTLGVDARKEAEKRSKNAALVMTDMLGKITQRRDHLRANVIKTLEGEAKAKAQNLHDELDAFVKRFTPDQFTEDKLLPVFEKFGQNMKGPWDAFKGTTPTSNKVDSMHLRAFMSFTEQLAGHRASLRDPRLYADGLNHVVPVLPTAGRDLRNCPWLGSTAADMAKSAALIKTRDAEYSLAKSPIIVFDQTDAKNRALWDKNDEYCRQLEAQHATSGLKIVHVSMADVKRLAGPGLQKMFDTTGEDFAGYGGARNMAYLLGPVIRQCENEGRDWRTLSPEEVLPLVQKHSLERSSNKLFMGDDTDHISEGTMLSKAVLAREHDGEYGLVATMRDGRNTMTVSEAQTNNPLGLLSGGVDGFIATLNGGNSWKSDAKAAGMGCTISDARFCLDLPLGAEEKHHEAMKSAIDQFSKASHLASDRQRDFGDFFVGHLPYTNTTGMAKSLLREAELPWNSAHKAMDNAVGLPKFDSLQSVMSFASDPVQAKLAQQHFFSAMVDWRSSVPPASGALTLDITPADALRELDAKIEKAVRKVEQAEIRLTAAIQAKARGPRSAADPRAAGALQQEFDEATMALAAAKTEEANSRKNKALLAPAYTSAPPDIKTANAAVVRYFLAQHPELKPEDREQLAKIQDAYENAGAEMKQCRQYMDKLLDELVPATHETPVGSKLPAPQLKQALEASLAGDPPDKAARAIAKVKLDMEGTGVDFSKNRLLRDMNLMTQSVGGGGFVSLAQKLHTPAPRIEIGHAPEPVRHGEARSSPSPGVVLSEPGPGVEPPSSRDVRLSPGPEVISLVSKSDSPGTVPPRVGMEGQSEPPDPSGVGLGEKLSEGEVSKKGPPSPPLSTRDALLNDGYKVKSPTTNTTGPRVTNV